MFVVVIDRINNYLVLRWFWLEFLICRKHKVFWVKKPLTVFPAAACESGVIDFVLREFFQISFRIVFRL